jgi:hypothetical protein
LFWNDWMNHAVVCEVNKLYNLPHIISWFY